MEAALHPWPALGALLMRDGLVTRDELEAVLAEQRDSPHQRISGSRLGEVLVERGSVTQAQIAQLVAEQYTLPFLELTEPEVSVRAAVLLPEELAREVRALPISVLPDGSLLVAISDPPLAVGSDELHAALGVPLRFAVATPDAVDAAIDHAFERARELGATAAEDDSTQAAADDEVGDEASEAEQGDPARAEGATPGLARPWPALGALLIRDGIVTEQELDAALAQQRVSGSKRLGEILVNRGAMTPADVARLVAEQYELPFVDLVASEVDMDVALRLPEELARRFSAVPVSAREDEVVVALADPTRVLDAHDLRAAITASVRFVGASPEAVDEAIALVHAPARLHEVELPADDDVDPHFDDAMADDLLEATASVRRWDAAGEEGEADVVVATATDVETTPEPAAMDSLPELLEHVLALGASHVHFTPGEGGVLVRARVDGVLRDVDGGGADRAADVVAWLKELADLEIGGRRVHREASVAVPFGEGTVGLRLTLVRTTGGEKLTLSVHDPESGERTLSELGLPPDDERTLRAALAEPFGAVVVSGPAGSGRTTTLYALLQELDSRERAVATIEQPVERDLPRADQIEVSPGTGLTFGRALRAVLRSDQDVVAVGDLRDDETAQLSLGAATGHLVLAAMESRSAASAIDALERSSGEPGLVTSAVLCVVSQRLARRTCADCRETYYADADELALLGRPPEEAVRRLLARGRGCDACGGSGFRGRVALFEVLPVTDEVRALVDRGATVKEIEAVAVANGMRTLAEEGARLCLEGVTTAAEIRRILGSSGR
jgi:type IV pilus assembly protein PilB